MLEMLRFYSQFPGKRPSFGSNAAAATVWTMLIFAFGTLLALVFVAAFGRLTLVAGAVLGAIFVVFVALARASLPEARRQYEIDRVARRWEQENRGKAEAWAGGHGKK